MCIITCVCTIVDRVVNRDHLGAATHPVPIRCTRHATVSLFQRPAFVVRATTHTKMTVLERYGK